VHELAAVQVQRVYRGLRGRRRARRKREWEAAAPGPERLSLGLKLINESKEAFAQQQEEIDALHRAQVRAVAGWLVWGGGRRSLGFGMGFQVKRAFWFHTSALRGGSPLFTT
jgi:hypothetical protein